MATNEDVQKGLTSQEQPKPGSTLKALVNTDGMKKRFTQMLGEKKAAGFLSSLISSYEGSAALRKCQPMNVVAQAAVAASLDLPIIGSLGFAAIVPYAGVATFQMMAKGFIQLAIRSGQYRDMNASEVYEDELAFWNPITGEFKFTPPETWRQRYENKTDKIVGYVAFFKLVNGFEKYLYMTKAQLLAHGKKYSASFKKGGGLWVENPHVMMLKTVIKMLLSKWGILSVDMERAMTLDQAAVNPDDDGDITFPDQPALLEAPEGGAAGAPAPEGEGAATKGKDGQDIKF